jgi:hypothetical protein
VWTVVQHFRESLLPAADTIIVGFLFGTQEKYQETKYMVKLKNCGAPPTLAKRAFKQTTTSALCANVLWSRERPGGPGRLITAAMLVARFLT